jgi:hypothetical protein
MGLTFFLYIVSHNYYMIKQDKVFIKVNLRNYKYYRDKGYNLDIKSITDTYLLEVPIDEINKNSKVKITAICEICSKESTIMLCKYWKNFERHNFYGCFSCKNKKREMTSLRDYGVISYSKTDEFKIKFEKTSLLKYGVSNPNKSKEIRDKIKKTNIEKYGVDTYFKTRKSKEFNRVWMSSDEFRVKSKKTMLKKYGVDSYSKSDEFKRIISDKIPMIVSKIRQTFIEKYGVDSYFKTKEFKDSIDWTEWNKKRIKTCLDKYGVDNVSKLPHINEKILKSKLERGKILPPEVIGEWLSYKREVRKITNRNKKKLYEEWNGLDYYDRELIKGYSSFSDKHRFYPTIDHKISIYYGFINKIPSDYIGSFENLCITKRYINSIKNILIESDFLAKFPKFF